METQLTDSRPINRWDQVRYTNGVHAFLATVRSTRPDRDGMVTICRDDDGRFVLAHKDNLELEEREIAA